MRNLEMGILAERLLTERFRINDLDRLFLFLREKSYGLAPVREIGDFVAHSDQRVKGPVTEEVKDFLAILNMMIPPIMTGTTLDPSNLPSTFVRAIRANFKRMDTRMIRQRLGLNRRTAGRLLDSAVSKFGTDGTGRTFLCDPLSPAEEDLVRLLCKVIITKPAFTDHDLLRCFASALEKNHLLDNKKKNSLAKAAPAITLFAVCAMHKVYVDSGDGVLVELCAGTADGLIAVHALTGVSHSGVKARFGCQIFSTTLNASEWCDERLSDLEASAIFWDCPIELTLPPKIIPLLPECGLRLCHPAIIYGGQLFRPFDSPQFEAVLQHLGRDNRS